MTITKRFIADISDIVTIRLVCRRCKAVVSTPPLDTQEIREGCPNCKADWFLHGTEDLKQVKYLISSIQRLHSRSKEAPCDVQLEFNLPES